MDEIKFETVFSDELKYISLKRSSLKEKDDESVKEDLTALALSGGGIRSATIALGFLSILNEFGILKKFDYLSTVSGGGYTGGYVSAKLNKTNDYSELFSEKDIEHLRDYGSYMTPGKGFHKFINTLRLAGAFIASLIMNLVWIVLSFLVIVLIFKLISEIVENYTTSLSYTLNDIVALILIFSVLILAIHYFFHYFRHFRLWSSNVLNYIEGFLLLIISVVFLFHLGNGFPYLFPTLNVYNNFLIIALALFIAGYFGNPNLLAMHRFYRDRLAGAYLKLIKDNGDNILLKDLTAEIEKAKENPAPYHLINTCANLLGRNDETFRGSKASDYFLLSSKYCGSNLTGYIKTTETFYNKMTLSTAVAVSGAALNPNMGLKTNKTVSFFMTLFNLQLGYWTFNPNLKRRIRIPFTKTAIAITWWPYYLILLLLTRTDSNRQRVNLSDGGHIENLAIYELLKRKCKLILALDNGMDSQYTFGDLNNLVIRARNELGIEIKFRKGYEPESHIKTNPSFGFSKSHFTVADVTEMPGKNDEGNSYQGILVYVKSSLLAQKSWKIMNNDDPEYGSFMYKTYHSQFPHEPTSDQFFDKDQWNAYYNLGRFIAAELLDINIREKGSIDESKKKFHEKTHNGLITFFDDLIKES